MLKLSSEKIMVFFDESGKRKNKPNLMGGLSVPYNIYCLPDFQLLSRELEDGKMTLHFKDYYGDSIDEQSFLRVGEIIAKYGNLLRMIVINYDYSILANRNEFGKDLVEDMIYTKFPERILYGLLRGYGKNTYIDAEILIEQATEYESLQLYEMLRHKEVTLNLDKLVKDQLNIQSLYRGEHYVISDCRLVSKGVDIGVEMTDMLLGIVRTILENKESTTIKTTAKNRLVMDLLNNTQFYNFINSARYFEWSSSKELTEIELVGYIQLFIAKHYL